MRTKKILLYSILILIAAAVIIYFSFATRQETAVLTSKERSEAPGHFLDLKEGPVHYISIGPDSAQTVVLIHGGGVTGMEVWANQIPFLVNKGYRVIAYDLYGRGFSARPRIKNTPGLFLDELTGLLDSLNVQKPVDLISMSMGAIIAVDYTNQNPGRVNKLVMIDPALTGGNNTNFLMRLPVVSDVLMTLYWYPRAVENQRKEFVDQQLFDSYSKRLQYFMNFKGYKQSNYSTWMDMLNQNRMADLNKLQPIPTLLIYGMKDPYFSAQTAQACSEHYPGLQVHAIPDAGHMPHFEKAELVNPVLDNFLQQ